MKAGLALLGALLAATVQAQEAQFPHKGAVEITVLFPAGSSADVTARLLADGMSKQLGGAKVLVVNRPGAGGAIGYKYVVSQKPDGYSIVWNSNSISTTFHSGMLPFDYHEFDAVARVLVESPVIAVRGESRKKPSASLSPMRNRVPRASRSETPGSGVTPISPRSRYSRPRVPRSWMCRSAPHRWCRACSEDRWMRCCSFLRRSRAT